MASDCFDLPQERASLEVQACSDELEAARTSKANLEGRCARLESKQLQHERAMQSLQQQQGELEHEQFQQQQQQQEQKRQAALAEPFSLPAGEEGGDELGSPSADALKAAMAKLYDTEHRPTAGAGRRPSTHLSSQPASNRFTSPSIGPILLVELTRACPTTRVPHRFTSPPIFPRSPPISHDLP